MYLNKIYLKKIKMYDSGCLRQWEDINNDIYIKFCKK